jgi:hypothetical protein
MQGQAIWHIQIRRTGQTDFEIAEIRTAERHAPKKDELINVVVPEFGVNRRENIVAKVMSFTKSTSGSRTKYTVCAAAAGASHGRHADIR